ncbi:MAG: hypothetical protein LIP05_09115 [Tannerellaceae bacterium]|nr:hypothetical protein [Tannerellaceae bacterium]
MKREGKKLHEKERKKVVKGITTRFAPEKLSRKKKSDGLLSLPDSYFS